MLNFALDGLRRLLTNEEFSYKKDPDEIKTEMQRSGSGIANFVFDRLEESEEEWISKDAMYSAYTRYTTKNKLPSEIMTNFGKKLTKYSSYILDGKKRIPDINSGKNKQITGWRNVKIKVADSIDTDEDIRDIIDF